MYWNRYFVQFYFFKPASKYDCHVGYQQARENKAISYELFPVVV